MSALPAGCRFRDRCPLAQERCQRHPELKAVAAGHLSRCWVAQDAAGDATRETPQAERRMEASEHAL
jgi:peptide/nickel transport system ATP-binding protein